MIASWRATALDISSESRSHSDTESTMSVSTNERGYQPSVLVGTATLSQPEPTPDVVCVWHTNAAPRHTHTEPRHGTPPPTTDPPTSGCTPNRLSTRPGTRRVPVQNDRYRAFAPGPSGLP